MKPRSYNSPKFLNFIKRGEPWGDLNAPEATFEQQILLFSVTPDKKRNNVRIKYSQNHFKSTFGSAYLNSKKIKLKLAKQVKKEPRKASFPWDLGLIFGQPIKYELIDGLNYFKTENEIQNIQPIDSL